MHTVRRLIEDFTPRSYNISLTIDRLERSFDGLVTIQGTSHRDGQLSVHAKDLAIRAAHVDGHQAEISVSENDEVVIHHDSILATSSHTVVIDFAGTISDAMHGMYPCYYEHDGVKKELLATQFESHHAREVFPCIDEPEAKATFDVTLTTETDVTVLGNMPVKTQNIENDLLVTTFEQSPVMSSYLVAWVIGELHAARSTSKSGVDVAIWATPAQPASSLAFALDIATRAIDFFDDYFGIPYPLPKADHVALPDFSSGAMENWGLITYREVALLAEPGAVSISSKQRIATVICHELSHQWFGNLVTMKWWDDLWLNESFANLMEYIAIDALEPSWNIWMEFASYEMVAAMRRDAIDGVQSVHVDVHHPDEITTLFDPSIVYAKGSCLMRMLEHFVGHDAFRAGLKAYFTKHAYSNTVGNDLWAALAEASGKDVSAIMETWVSESGYPVVHVEDGVLRQEQFFVGQHQPSSKVWPIPLNATSKNLPATFDTTSLSHDESHDLRINSDSTSYFLAHYTGSYLTSFLERIARREANDLERLHFMTQQSMLARGRVISSAELVPLLEVYGHETSQHVWENIAATFSELKKFVDGDEQAEMQLKTFARDLAIEQYTRLGWTAHKDESEDDTKLRSTILGMMAYSEDQEVSDMAYKLYSDQAVENFDPEIRPIILSIVVRDGRDRSILPNLMRLYERTSQAELQIDICAGVTSTRQRDEIIHLLSQFTRPDVVRSQDVTRWFAYMIRSRYARDETWKWLQDNWAWIKQTFDGDKSYDDYPRYAAGGMIRPEHLDQYTAFFEPLKSDVALSRAITMGITEIAGRIELIEHDREAVKVALAERK